MVLRFTALKHAQYISLIFHESKTRFIHDELINSEICVLIHLILSVLEERKPMIHVPRRLNLMANYQSCSSTEYR